MNDEFDPKATEQTEAKLQAIILESTSPVTSNTNPIILKTTDLIQKKFKPTIIDNGNEPRKCVSGKLIYEKKKKKDTEFPTEKISPQIIKTGEYMEITLDTSETLRLFEGLKERYELYGSIGKTPMGNVTYTKCDSSLTEVLSTIMNEPKLSSIFAKEKNISLLKKFLEAITQAESTESLTNSLLELDGENVSILTNSVSIVRMKRMINLLEQNLENSDEEFWQKAFKDNQWILSQVFSSPCTIFEEKAYVGGKSISNEKGNICDFVYKNNLTDNIAIIEIKTPCTKIIGSKYRGTYSLSSDMSGSINQVLNYKDTLTKGYYQSAHSSQEDFQVINPHCVVIIGRVSELNKPEIAALENYRNSLTNITIIAYDELLERIKNILTVFSTKSTKTEETNAMVLPFSIKRTETNNGV